MNKENTAAAVGIEEFAAGPINAFGGVIARPTLLKKIFNIPWCINWTE